jgi:hypothetical protein
VCRVCVEALSTPGVRIWAGLGSIQCLEAGSDSMTSKSRVEDACTRRLMLDLSAASPQPCSGVQHPGRHHLHHNRVGNFLRGEGAGRIASSGGMGLP